MNQTTQQLLEKAEKLSAEFGALVFVNATAYAHSDDSAGRSFAGVDYMINVHSKAHGKPSPTLELAEQSMRAELSPQKMLSKAERLEAEAKALRDSAASLPRFEPVS